MTRALTIKVDKQPLLDSLGWQLNQKLIELEEEGWEINSVTPINYKQWSYPQYFDAVCYTIVFTKPD